MTVQGIRIDVRTLTPPLVPLKLHHAIKKTAAAAGAWGPAAATKRAQQLVEQALATCTAAIGESTSSRPSLLIIHSAS